MSDDLAMQISIEKMRDWWSNITFSISQKRSLLSISALVIALSFFLVMRGSTQEIPLAPEGLSVTEAVAQVTVDVAGAVKNPGVYTLPANSRVMDAIKMAGDKLKGADLSDVNLARIIKDGEQIYIYAKSSVSRATSSAPRVKSKPAGFVLVNRANSKEFESLDGIGPVLASRIIAFRKANGPFLTIEDLLKVPGIGAATLAKFKAKLRM
jgi:competence protein ComEA